MVTELYSVDTCKLLMTDTDSLLFHIETEDLYRDLESFKDVLDTSNYDKDHRLFSEQNRFEPGTFKDELPPNKDSGVPYEFVGLKSKMYCITNTQNQDIKKAKGVSKHVVREFNNAD